MSEQDKQELQHTTFDLSCQVKVTYEIVDNEPAIVLSIEASNRDGLPLSKTFSAPAAQLGVSRIAFAKMLIHLTEDVEANLRAALPEVATQIAGATLALSANHGLSQRHDKKAFAATASAVQKVLKRTLGQTQKRGPKPKTLSVFRIKAALRKMPAPRHKTKAPAIAGALGVSERTLMRFLKSQGTNWKSVKNQALMGRQQPIQEQLTN